MLIQIHSDTYPLTISLAGALDGASAPALCEQLFEVSQTTSGDVILDLDAVDFMDSIGLGLLVSFYRQLGVKERRLHVTSASGQPNDLLRITGSGKVLCAPITQA